LRINCRRILKIAYAARADSDQDEPNQDDLYKGASTARRRSSLQHRARAQREPGTRHRLSLVSVDDPVFLPPAIVEGVSLQFVDLVTLRGGNPGPLGDEQRRLTTMQSVVVS
jgi:hypothetical protein